MKLADFQSKLAEATKRDLYAIGRTHNIYVDLSDTKPRMIQDMRRWAERTSGGARKLMDAVDAMLAEKTKPDPSKLRTSDHRVKELIQRTYPEYRGRKVKIVQRDTYHMSDYWSGGSRTYVVAVNLANMQVEHHKGVSSNPFNDSAHDSFSIPDGVAMVEHVIFCGKDLGIRINVNANTYPKMLPSHEPV